MGAFHTMCSYMGSLGKMMTRCSFKDILIESGVMCQWLHHQSQANNCVYQRMNDAVERMILNKFCNTSPCFIWNVLFCSTSHSGRNPSETTFTEVFSSDQCMKMVQDYNGFKDEIRQGSLGNTEIFWLMYSDLVWILMRVKSCPKLGVNKNVVRVLTSTHKKTIQVKA